MNIVLNPSKLQSYFFYALIFSIMVLILSLDLRWDITAIALVFLVVGSYWQKPAKINTLQKLAEETWQLEFASGKTFTGNLLGNSLSTRYFSILMLKTRGHYVAKKVLIFKDALSDKNYHLLRLQLKGLVA